MNGKGIWLIVFLAGLGYLAARSSTPDSTTTRDSSTVGYPCTQDCSGHRAGYNWAKQHSIDEVDNCNKAGETSNSPSFAEGCRAYVEENQETTDDDDH
jgi:hypothetical protein